MKTWKLGICAPLSRMEEAKALGYDYIEPALSALAALSDAEFDAALERARTIGLPVEAMNVFLPGSIRLTGPQVDADAIAAYLEKALARAAAFGVQVVVFGSGGARSYPEGFDKDAAMAQIHDFLRICGEIAARHGIVIAIEPLNRRESNVIHLVAEAVALTRETDLPAVRALGDTYHMALEEEPLSALCDAGALLAHVHVANPEGRRYPAPGDGCDYRAVFAALTQAGYTGRVSAEASGDFAVDGAETLRVLREAMGG